KTLLDQVTARSAIQVLHEVFVVDQVDSFSGEHRQALSEIERDAVWQPNFIDIQPAVERLDPASEVHRNRSALPARDVRSCLLPSRTERIPMLFGPDSSEE